jgi:hypothetical protein
MPVSTVVLAGKSAHRTTTVRELVAVRSQVL